MDRIPVEIYIFILRKLSVRDLITMGAINRCTRTIVTPLMHGCRLLRLLLLRGEHSAVAFLMETKHIDIRVHDAHGMTVLHYAAMKGYGQIVRLLTSDPGHKALLDVPENRQNDTPLILAARYQNETIFQLLLDIGADVNARNAQGENVLFWATKRRDTKLARMLLKRGADPNQVARHGFTPLIQAIINGCLDLAAVLLEGGCNVEQPDIQGYRPLVWAVVLDALAMVNLLFSYHARINPSTRRGAERSPLVWAVMRGAVEMVQLLLCHGASVGQAPPDRQAPLMWAVIHRATSVARLLLQYGARPNERGISGETALAWALFNNDMEMVQLLLEYKACPEVTKRDELFALPLPSMRDRISLTDRSIKGSGDL